MGGSHRHGQEPCTPTLVHGGTLSYLLLIRSVQLGTSIPLRRVLLRLVRPGTPGRAGGRSLLLHLRMVDRSVRGGIHPAVLWSISRRWRRGSNSRCSSPFPATTT